MNSGVVQSGKGVTENDASIEENSGQDQSAQRMTGNDSNYEIKSGEDENQSDQETSENDASYKVNSGEDNGQIPINDAENGPGSDKLFDSSEKTINDFIKAFYLKTIKLVDSLCFSANYPTSIKSTQLKLTQRNRSNLLTSN